jgi:hypothetical protein
MILAIDLLLLDIFLRSSFTNTLNTNSSLSERSAYKIIFLVRDTKIQDFDVNQSVILSLGYVKRSTILCRLKCIQFSH